MNSPIIPFQQRITCTIAEAILATGVKRTRLYQWISDGRVETRKEGRQRLILVRTLIAALDPASIGKAA